MLWSWSLGMHDGEGGQSLSIRSLEAGSARVRTPSCLLHEMCHLASWTIDKQPNEAHGPIFKKWRESKRLPALPFGSH
jgi:hypothetical protein